VVKYYPVTWIIFNHYIFFSKKQRITIFAECTNIIISRDCKKTTIHLALKLLLYLSRIERCLILINGGKMLKTIIDKIKDNHLLLMALCCAIPILGFFILSFFGLKETKGYYALFLLCPLAHIFMMRGMKSCPHEQHQPEKPKQIEYKPS
jgi:hypothetical protein